MWTLLALRGKISEHFIYGTEFESVYKYEGHSAPRAILSKATTDIIAAETQVFIWKVLNLSRLVRLLWQ